MAHRNAPKPTIIAGDRRQWPPPSYRGPMGMALATVLGGLATIVACLAMAAPALAGTTSASSFTKTGTDANNGSSVSATSSVGKTSPGDTLNWVMHYDNSTGSPANVKITDPIGANQSFVKGSLVVPPGTDLSPEWSTNAGGSFATSEPASGVNEIGASGLVSPTGLGSTSAFKQISTPTTGNGESGDGFEDIFYNGNVYNLHHHFYPGEMGPTKPLTLLACHVVGTGQECPGYNGGVYANSESGRPFSNTLSEDNFTTMSSNWTALDQSTGKLYFATTIFGTANYGIGCLNLANNTSCGFTQLGTDPEVTTSWAGGITGGATIGSNYYLLEYTGKLICFNITSGSTCGTSTAYPSASITLKEMESSEAVNWAGSNYVFTSTSTSNTAWVEDLSCVNVSTGQTCPGYPLAVPGSNSPTLVPILNSSGETAGVCNEWFETGGVTSTRKFACYDVSGKSIATPAPYSALPAGSATSPWPVYAGTTVVVGTKMYYDASTGSSAAIGDEMSYQYQCFDWSTGAPCAGFNSPVEKAGWATGANSGTNVDLRTYTLVQDPYLPGCLAEDGDAGVVQYFDAATGALGCTGLNGEVKVNPPTSYCDGTSHATAWSQIEISGISPSQYTGAIYTVYDKEGNPVPGFKEVSLAPGQDSVNISSIPMSGSTSELSVVMTIANPTPGVIPQISMTFQGTSGGEVCFKTTVGAAQCNLDQTIANQGDALTSALNGLTDAPAGDESGEALFLEPKNPLLAGCEADLSIEKTADTAKVAAGGQVMYTLLVQNHGPDTATSVKVSDAIPAGLSIVSAQPSQGACTVAGAIDCTLGTIENGGSAQILVTANVASSDAAGTKITNTATVSAFQKDPNPGNNSSESTVEVVTPPPTPPTPADLQVVKTVNHAVANYGEALTYTLAVKNNGPGTAPNAGVTDTSTKALRVLSAKPSQGTCTAGEPFRCTLGSLTSGRTATVTIKAIPQRTGGQTNSVSAASGCTASGECPVDPNPKNNVSSAKTTVRPALKLVKKANRKVVKAGQKIVYHLTVSDPSPVTVDDVKVCDRLPLGLVFVKATPKAHIHKGQQCWTYKSLGAHKSKTIKLIARALKGARGDRVNHATASGKGVKTVDAKAKVRIKPAKKRATPVTG